MGGISLANIKIPEFEAWIRGIARDEIDREKQRVADKAAPKAAKAAKAAVAVLLAVGLSLPFLARAEEPLGAQLYAAKRIIALPAIGAAQVSSAPDTDATGRFYAFDSDSDETCWFPLVTLPSDVTSSQTAEFRVSWSAATAVTGTVYWNIHLAKGKKGGAIGSFSVLTAADANGGLNYTNVTDWATLTTNLEPDEVISLKVVRDADYSGDTLNKQDALFQQLDVKISETIKN